MKFKTLLILTILFSGYSYSQDTEYIDSLKNLLPSSKEDTNKFYLLSDIAWEYIGNEPDTSLSYTKQALELSLKLGFTKGTAKSLYNIGVTYFNQGKYSEAISPVLEAAKLFEKIGHKRGLSACYNSIGNIYKELREFDLSLEYQLKALAIQRELNAYAGVCNSLMNIGNIYLEKEEMDKAMSYYSQALEIAIEQNDKALIAKIYNNIGICKRKMSENEEALQYYLKSIALKEEMNSMTGLAITYTNVGQLYLNKKDFAKALECFNKGLSLADECASRDELKNAYAGMAEVYAGLHIFDSAYFYQKKYVELHDSLYNVENTNYITELEAKYESEKKERKIEALNNETEKKDLMLRQNQIIIYSLSIGGVFILALALLIFNAYKQRQTRHKMFLKNIETEEKERKRFAEDLHDGLGPLLSSVSMYINELQSDRHDEKEKAEFLTYTGDLVDEAVKNTRLIANKLMPGVLNDYGLVTALKTFSDKLKKSGTVHISLLSDKEGQRYHPAIEITLYRVLLEMINNTLKHAQANNISISISDNDKTVTINYEDDGKGFDYERIIKDPKKGLGLGNIMNRVNSIRGICTIESAAGKGMRCMIAVNYLKYFS